MSNITMATVQHLFTIKLYIKKKHLFKKDDIIKIDEIKLNLFDIPNIGEIISTIKGKRWDMSLSNKIKDEEKTSYKVLSKEYVFNERLENYYINLIVKEIK